MMQRFGQGEVRFIPWIDFAGHPQVRRTVIANLLHTYGGIVKLRLSCRMFRIHEAIDAACGLDLLERRGGVPYILKTQDCLHPQITSETDVSRKPLLIIFITVFVDLLGFGIVLPLLPRYAEHFLPASVSVETSSTDVTQIEPTAKSDGEAVSHGAKAGTPSNRSRMAGLILGCLMASFSAMQFLFAPLWGMLSDRIGRRPVLLVGLAGSTVFYALFALVTQLGNSGPIFGLSPLIWLFVTRIGAGISGATIPTAQAYIADCTDEKSRGKGMAIIGAAFGIGFTFGPLLGSMFVSANPTTAGQAIPGYVVAAWNDEGSARIGQTAPSSAPGYVAAVLSGLAFLFGLTSLPESLKADLSARSKSHGWLKLGSTIRVLSHPSLGRIVLAVFMTTFAFGLFETTLATLTKRIGVDDRGNFYVFSYIGLVLTLAQGLLVRRLIPRLGELRMAIIGVVLMTIGMFLIGQMAARSQEMRVLTEQIAQLGIDRQVKSFRTENGRFPDSLEELTATIAKENQLSLPTLPAGFVYAYDKDRNTLLISSGSSQSFNPFWVLIAVLPVIVVGFSATTPSLQSLLSLNSAEDEQGEVLGVGQGLSALARIVGPVVGLTLQGRDLAYPYWCGGLLMALGIVMVARLKNVTRNPGSEPISAAVE